MRKEIRNMLLDESFISDEYSEVVISYIEDILGKNKQLENALSTIQETIKPMVAQNSALIEANDKLNKMLNDKELSHLERIAIAVERIAYLTTGTDE